MEQRTPGHIDKGSSTVGVAVGTLWRLTSLFAPKEPFLQGSDARYGPMTQGRTWEAFAQGPWSSPEVPWAQSSTLPGIELDPPERETPEWCYVDSWVAPLQSQGKAEAD